MPVRPLQPLFAPVAPIHLLRAMWEHETETARECLGSYHLLLAHDVMESANKQIQFGALFDDVRDFYGKSAQIIMDNSVVELGDAVDMRWVLEAARHARANIVVVPDAMSNWQVTVGKFQKVADNLIAADREQFEYMFVPQGTSMSEFVRCVEAVLSSHPELVSWIGIPRVATEVHGVSRVRLIDIIDAVVKSASYNVGRRKPIKYHLLGFSNDVIDDIQAARLGVAEGIDSAVPVRVGQDNKRFYASVSDYGKRGDYWTRDQKLSGLAINNMEYFRRLIRA